MVFRSHPQYSCTLFSNLPCPTADHGRAIIDSRRGVSGFSLLVKPEELSLYSIYQAINNSEQVHVFDLHQNPNDACIVGRHILPVLTDVFRGIEEKAEQELKHTTLADCMQKVKTEIGKEEST